MILRRLSVVVPLALGEPRLLCVIEAGNFERDFIS